MSIFSEDALIQHYFTQAANSPFALGLQDDAACMAIPNGFELVITCDTLVEGVHFFVSDPAATIAQKALRVNLSDLAAKGAQPYGFVLSLAMPVECFDPAWLAPFSAALCADAQYFNCPLLGGDTVKTLGPFTITITAFGLVPQGKMVKRTTAKAGDILYVSGTIGDAALGLKLHPHPAFEPRRTIPQPRVELAPILQHYATAALDISDGFAGDCMKMLAFAGAGLTIACEDVPLSTAAREMVMQDSQLWPTILAGGDDYELLFTIAPQHEAEFLAVAKQLPCGVQRLGVLLAGAPVQFTLHTTPLALTRMSYSHL